MEQGDRSGSQPRRSHLCSALAPGSFSHRSFYPDGRQPLAPSAINPEQLVHIRGGSVIGDTLREMSSEDIRKTVLDFKNASRVARDAGFDGVQIQTGFVYLITSFCMRPRIAAMANMGGRSRTVHASSLKFSTRS